MPLLACDIACLLTGQGRNTFGAEFGKGGANLSAVPVTARASELVPLTVLPLMQLLTPLDG